ncbi:T9SS type A sorting domain-containing protein [Zobellia uliginosa]|uniref:T9SS type A sorting domain-containing protein n=1 Tax=Zobellia uliginosa TaxID=143224 RepID=UPI001C06572B|nr:T9SS type A sorting domain-containing protein [Zobellia uliginosa]MBU2947173.1 T9SS type A sorting domain-containing protein [Zobellia uliginosa]
MRTKITFLSIVFFTICFSNVLWAQNSIKIIDPPSSVEAGEIVGLDVDYTNISGSAYVLVRFKSALGDNLEQDFILVGNGSDIERLSIKAPTSEGSYSFQAQLLKDDGKWSGLANYNADVSVANGTVIEPVKPSVGGNSVSISNPPTSVKAGEMVNLDISYTNNSGSAYVLVRFKDSNGGNLEQDFEAVGNGSGTKPLSIKSPTSEGSYSFQAQLLKDDDKWSGLANDFFEGVTVVENPPENDNDQLTLTTIPDKVAQGETYDIGFDYSFSGDRYVQAYVTNKNIDSEGAYVKIGKVLQEFSKGADSEIVKLEITGEPVEFNLLVVQVFEVIKNGNEDQWNLVVEKTLDNIQFGSGYGFGEKNTTPNGVSEYMRYYNRDLETTGGHYNGDGQGSGTDHILAPTNSIYRSNWWVNKNWIGPIKSHYGENALNGKEFWVEWQNLGSSSNSGHAEFDIRVEKSTGSDLNGTYGFPSVIGDITGPLKASFTGKWDEGSTGRCHINMTAWIYGVDSEGERVRSDVIIHAWDNSGDIRSNYERSFQWSQEGDDTIYTFEKIGTASDDYNTYDVLRTIPGGEGESCSYNLIPSGWRRNHIDDFPTESFKKEVDVAEIINQIIEIETENGPDTRKLVNSNVDIPVPTMTEDWTLEVMEWTITGQSGDYKHEPGNPDFDVNTYIPNSRGRFTFEEYYIQSPCESNPKITCPNSIALKTQIAQKDSIVDKEIAKDFNVSPNPFINSFEYEYSVKNYEDVSVDLYALNGRKIETLKAKESHRPGNYSDAVDTSNLDSGIYILRINTSEGEEAIKLIKN